eukprot:scaffold144746_cov166-Phaeocystis_antarctica.AAC.1
MRLRHAAGNHECRAETDPEDRLDRSAITGVRRGRVGGGETRESGAVRAVGAGRKWEGRWGGRTRSKRPRF